MSVANNFNAMLAWINQIEKSNLVFNHSIKIRFLRNFTIEPIEPFLKFHLYQANIHPIISYSDYDSIHQEILDSTSYLWAEKPDIIVLSLLDFQLQKTEENIRNLYNQLVENTSALILVNTFIPPFYSPLISSLEETGINYFIREYVIQRSSRCILVDWERYLRLMGEAECMDYRYWYLNKAPFKKSFLNCYAKDITRVVKVIKGQAKKCLILDCDNTLWGGIIGEDGINNIKLNNYEYPGKIFYDFQQSVLDFYQQGILIALCSKNNEEDVWQVIEGHSHCLLKRSHIVAHRINWKDKATNIVELAEELNLGLDSFVFVDDSPVECDFIRKFLPNVTVLQVPKELYLYPQLLLKETFFDVLSMNEDDKKRSMRYQQENERRKLAKEFENIEDYLCNLELMVTIHPVKETEISRIAQLTQKTNQFNLSVKRYTEGDIKSFCDSDTSKVFSLSAKDRYGDYGLTGVLIANCEEKVIKIDSLLLSCRILSRRIEHAFLFCCLQWLHHEWGINRYHADFSPTKKNTQIKDFLDTVGFNFREEKENMHIYELEGAPKVPRIDFIQIRSESVNEFGN